MNDFKIAVLSDIHGNSLALKEVLRDIKNRDITNIVNLGDSLYGPLDPAETAELLIEMNITSVSGNEDRILIEETNAGHNSPSLQFTKNLLAESHKEWLLSLPLTKVFLDEILLFHGTPSNDHEYLLHKICNGRLTLCDEEEIIKKLKCVEQKIILCGHDHTPNLITLSDGRLILNPGSVGCPAYFDDSAPVHAVETGSPFARYSIISKINSDLFVENIALPYDWNSAAELALQNGRVDWVSWLKYGRTKIK